MSSAENQSQLLVNYTDKNQGKILRIDFFFNFGKNTDFSKTFRIQIFFIKLWEKTQRFSLVTASFLKRGFVIAVTSHLSTLPVWYLLCR